MSDNYTHSLNASHRIQEKYDFYFLALTFTIVGFAVQTQPTDTVFIAKIAELLSWFLLITSGITGMFRIEKRYQLFSAAYSRTIKAEEIKLFKKAKSRGVSEVEYLQSTSQNPTLPVREEVINGLKEQMEEMNSEVEKDQFYAKILFYIQKSLFISGLLSIMVARGTQLFLEIYTTI